jgi:hypothetical protein
MYVHWKLLNPVEAIEVTFRLLMTARAEGSFVSIVQSWITDRPGILLKSRRFSVATS